MYDKYIKGIETYKEARKKWHGGEVATLVIANEREQAVIASTACHAGLSGTRASDMKRDYVVSGIQNTKLDAVGEYAFLDYLINRSPYQSVFPIKDTQYQIDAKCLVATADVSTNLLAGALIASRLHSERTYEAKLYTLLCAAGVTEDLAFVLVHYCKLTNSDAVHFWAGDSSHSALDYSACLGVVVKNFLEGKIPGARKETYAEDCNYNGVFKLFGNKGNAPLYTWLAKEFSLEDKPKVNKPSVNPFTKAIVAKDKDLSANTYPVEPFCKAMAKFQTRIFKEVGYEGLHNQQQRAV